MLGRHARSGAVRPAEHDGAAHLPARHIKRLRRRIDDLVDRLHGEIPGHEFDDGLQTAESRAHADAREAIFGDGRIDHAPRAEFLQQALADFVRALILRDLLAHQEHAFVAAHFLRHRVAQRIAHRHGDEFGAFGDFGFGGGHRRGIGFGFRFGRRGFCFRFGLRFRFRFRFRRELWCWCSWLARAFAFLRQRGNGLVDLHAFGAFGHQNLGDGALVHRLEFHRRLVGFDFRQHVARFNGVAFLHVPLGELALLHGGRQRGHENLNGHGGAS